MKRSLILVTALLLVATPLCLRAQSANPTPPAAQTPEHFYQLKLVVEELNSAGAITNSRAYQATVSTRLHSSPQYIKTGSRVPIMTSSGSSSNVQFQYIDLGTDMQIDRLEEAGNGLRFDLRVEISSMAPHSEAIGGVSEPVIRQNTWSSNVLVPIGRPTTVFSSDDLDTKGKMQVQVTAAPVE